MYFGKDETTAEMLEHKKLVRKSIASLNAQCEDSSKQTRSAVRKLDKALDKEEYFSQR